MLIFIGRNCPSALYKTRKHRKIKGHRVMAIYASLYELGMIKEEEIENYFSDGSSLTGLADSHVPGIEVSGGSLGQGITVATDIALS